MSSFLKVISPGRSRGVLSVFIWISFIAELALSGASALAVHPEVEVLLRSAVGRFLMHELAVPGERMFLHWAERQSVEAALLRLRNTYLRSHPGERELFLPHGSRSGPLHLTGEQETRLRGLLDDLLRTDGGEELQFLVPRAPQEGGLRGMWGRLQERMRARPRGGLYPIVESRPDRFGGHLHRINFEVEVGPLRGALRNPAFERGLVEPALEVFPEVFEPLGYRRVFRNGQPFVEIPDAEALNARLAVISRRHGTPDPLQSGARFQSFSGSDIPLLDYVSAVSRGVIPVAAEGRFFKHDMIVHAMGIARFLPAEVFSAVRQQFSVLLRLYHSPRLAGIPELRQRVLDMIEGSADNFDEITASLLLSTSPESGIPGRTVLESLQIDAASHYENLISNRTVAFNLRGGSDFTAEEQALLSSLSLPREEARRRATELARQMIESLRPFYRERVSP
jgi:hypothetical protein